MNAPLTPAHMTLIDALAEIAAEDYLTAQAAQQQAPEPEGTERALLPLDQAA